MFIHLGGDHIVLAKDVIAIVDYAKPETNKKMTSFLDNAAEKGTMIWIAKETTKSIVITNQYIYGSPISSLTLNRRA